MRRNWSPCALLVGIRNGTAAAENSMEDLKKLRIELPCDPAILLLGYVSQRKQGLREIFVHLCAQQHY